MPNDKTMPKKEKTDHKQVLLDLISKNYGTTNAMFMEKAFKVQEKKLEKDMVEGGANIGDVAKINGINLQLLDNLISGKGQSQRNTELGNTSVATQEQPQQQGMIANPNFFGFGGPDKQGNTRDLGTGIKILQLLAGGGVNKPQSSMETEDQQSLIAQRKANTALMEKMLKGQENGATANVIYRDPITGAEVDPATAEADMEAGLGVYQKNQILSTRSGIVEKPLNKVPELTEGEKKYVNDARILTTSLGDIKEKAKILRNKYGDATWQILQAQKLPYAIAQDPDVQAFKSDYTYLRGRIPFLLGGKQLTPTEAKRVDALTDPFGKSEVTYEKDLNRFHDEFTVGANIMKFGVNSGIMKKLIKGDRQKQTNQPKSSFRVVGVR